MSVNDCSSISGIARTEQRVTSEGSLEWAFAADGSLIPAEQASEAVRDESPTLEIEGWLESVAPERLARIDERVDELPATRAELLTHHAQKVAQELENTPEVPEMDVDGSSSLIITYHQHKRGPVMSEPERFEGSRTMVCPSCEKPVGVQSELKQLRSADEAETRIYHGACGCTWREDD